jgi:DNA polymerase III subunit beta
MKFTVSKEVFLRELFKIQGIIEKRQTMPILLNVLISAEENKISLLATNIEMGMITKFEAEVLEQGKITVSAKGLFDIVKELEPGLIEIETNESSLKIKSGRAEFNIKTLSASDFPKIPLPSKTPEINIKSNYLADKLDKIIFCASSDETKNNLNSIYIDKVAEENKIRFVSTDGHRLGIKEDVELELKNLGESKGLLIPRKGAIEVRKILDTEENISLMLESNYLYVFAGNTVLFVKEMDLKYPDYLRVIPSNNDKYFKINRKEMLNSLKRVSLVSTIKSKTVLFSLDKGVLILSSKSPDYGEASEEMSVDYQGDKLDIRFNAKYLIDILSSTNDEELEFQAGDSLSPILIKPEKEKTTCKYVVMPMRL